jgi:hypothetical protein
MTCPTCSTPIEISDNYCRQCGATLRASRFPAVIREQRIARREAPAVPVLLRRGVAAFVVSKAIEWTARNALPKVLSLALSKARALPTTQVREGADEVAPQPQRAVFGITRVWQEVRWFIPENREKPSRWRGPFRR